MNKIYVKAVFKSQFSDTRDHLTYQVLWRQTKAILYTQDLTTEELNKKHIDLYISNI